MSIIKDYHLDHDFDDMNVHKKQSGTLLKASVLSSIDQVVTPSQFSNEISYREPTQDDPLDVSFELDDEPVELTPEPVASSVSNTTLDESKIRQEVEAELTSHIDELITAISNLAKARDQVIQSSEEQLIDLSMAIAEKVVQKQIEIDPGVIKSVVEDTFNKISGSDRITFKINPADAAIFNEFQTHIESRLIGVEKIAIQQDATIEQGGCIIETDLGFVDVTIKEKLNIIAHTFKKIKATL